jgi:hypothetical protein
MSHLGVMCHFCCAAFDSHAASSSGESDCVLTPGFVSEQDDAVSGVVPDSQMKSLAKLLPVTARKIRAARAYRKRE